MSPETQRVVMAKLCGWTQIEGVTGIVPKSPSEHHHYRKPLPNYPGNPNAMHGALLTLIYPNRGLRASYCAMLDAVAGSWVESYFATSAQQCEAALKTLRLWKEGK